MKKSTLQKLLLLGIAIAFVLSLAPAAIAQPGEFVKGVLQPLKDGFPKRALTIIVVDDPASRDDIYAKTLQEALRGISPVPIVVSDENVAVGGTFHKLKDLADNREGANEGYYPTVITPWGAATDPLIDPGIKEIGMDIGDLNMVIITEMIPYIVIQKKNAPWGKTWASLVNYVKANPGKLKYISSNVGSGTDIAISTVFHKAGILDKLIKVPAKGMPGAAQVVRAGEGDVANSWAELALTHWQAGRIDPIMSTGTRVPAPWDKDPNVITLSQAGLGMRMLANGLGIVVPKGVSKAHVDWLFKLFNAAASPAKYAEQRAKLIPGIIVDIQNPTEANQTLRDMNTMADPVVRAIGLHIDQQK